MPFFMIRFCFLLPAGKCKLLPFLTYLFDECNAAYDWDDEDSESYEPHWAPLASNKSTEGLEPTPWTYQSQWSLKGTPYWGQFATYWGGGKNCLCDKNIRVPWLKQKVLFASSPRLEWRGGIGKGIYRLPAAFSTTPRHPDGVWIRQGSLTKSSHARQPFYTPRLKPFNITYLCSFTFSLGYVAEFEDERSKAEDLTKQLKSQGWIDRYSRAVFAEFTVYNAQTNFFSVITLLLEILPNGAYYHSPKIQTLRLYRYVGPEMAFVMACEITYMAFLLYFLYKQVGRFSE